MQPFQCDLQPQIQETHRNTHIDTTTRCRTQRRNPLRPERPQPHPPHTGGTFHRRLQPLYTEKYKVSCPGFLPNTSPTQRSCSHYNVSTSQSHHFPSSPLPFVTTSHRHHFPSSPLPFPTSSLTHVMSSLTPPCLIACYSFVMYCYVMQKTHTHHPSSMSSHITLHQCQVSQFYLSLTRKYCFPTSFEYDFDMVYDVFPHLPGEGC